MDKSNVLIKKSQFSARRYFGIDVILVSPELACCWQVILVTINIE